MTPKRVSYLLVLVIAAAGCTKDEDGEPVTPTVVAGLRYVNVVPDTTGMSIRVIDVVGDAPNTVNATFRTGGAPYGVGIVGLPLHTAVLAGTRSIRAFLSSTNPAIASTIVLDTSFTFEANKNYSVYLWGYANPANGTPALAAMLVTDSVPTIDTASVALRVIHLAPTFSGNAVLTTTAVNVTFDSLGLAAAPATGCVAPRCTSFTNVQPGEVRSYQTVTRRLAVTGPPAVAALNYRASVATSAAPTVLGFAADVPNGTLAVTSSQTNAIAGDLTSGSALTAILVPRSVAGTGATNFTTPAMLFIVDQRPPRAFP